MVQMISHGFISGAMFTCIGVMYDRMHTRMIKDYGGVINMMPWFAVFYVLFAMANCGLPGTSGFVGEFMVILASFTASPWIGCCRVHPDHRRRLHAVAGQARDLRPGDDRARAAHEADDPRETLMLVLLPPPCCGSASGRPRWCT